MITLRLLVWVIGALILCSGAVAWGKEVQATTTIPLQGKRLAPSDQPILKDQGQETFMTPNCYLVNGGRIRHPEGKEEMLAKDESPSVVMETVKTDPESLEKTTMEPEGLPRKKPPFRGYPYRLQFEGIYQLQHPSEDPVPQFLRFLKDRVLLLGFCDPCEEKDGTDLANWVASWLDTDHVKTEGGPHTVRAVPFGRFEAILGFQDGNTQYAGIISPSHIVLFDREKRDKMAASGSESPYPRYPYMFIPWSESP